MRQAVDVADAAFDTWLRTGLHGRHGAVAATPTPRGLSRLAEDERDAGRASQPLREGFRSRGEEDRNPARGFAVAVALSGLLWAAIVAVAGTFLG